MLDQNGTCIRNIHCLFINDLVILVRSDDDAVREIRIAVILFKLCIADTQIDVAADCRSPGKDRVVIQRRMNEILLDAEAW